MLEEGSAPRIPQPCEGVSYAAKIQKEDQLLDFSASSAAVLAAVRGLSPAPLAITHTPDGKMLKVLAAAPGEGADPYGVYAAPCELAAPVGTVVSLSDKGEGGITVKTADGTVVLTRVLPEGKGAMRASDFIRGRRIAVGDLLS
jgi:methionyl-tRNA formyltransferase